VDRLAAGSPWNIICWDSPTLPVDEATVNGFRVISTGHATASAALAGALRLHAGGLSVRSPAWGSYVTYVGRPHTDLLVSWATTPSPQSVHYATAGEWTFVSSSAIACAIAAAVVEDRNISLSRAFLRDYIAFGFGIGDASPYDSVWNIGSSDALAVHRGRATIVPRPSPQVSLLDDEGDANAAGLRLAEAVDAATRRGLSRSKSSVVARVSGGKDSRVILAALTNAGASVSCRVYGAEGDPDVTLARRITALVGAPLDVATPPLADPVGVRQSGLQVLRDAGGVPPSEAHLLPFGLSAGESADVALTMGHWPLYKGGMAKKMKYGRGGVEAALYRNCSAYVSRDVRAASQYAIDSWAAKSLVGADLELLYQWALDFRSGRYLASHHTHYSHATNLVYPLIDSEVAAVCNQMSMFSKVSELALFTALSALNRDLALVPLDRGEWRFANNERYAHLVASRPGASLATIPVIPEWENIASPRERQSHVLSEVARDLVACSNWHEIEALLSPEFSRSILKFARQELDSGEPFRDRGAAKGLWRTYAASLWLSGDWL